MGKLIFKGLGMLIWLLISLGIMAAGMAVGLVVAATILLLNRRREGGLVPYPPPDEQMPITRVLPDLPGQPMLDES